MTRSPCIVNVHIPPENNMQKVFLELVNDFVAKNVLETLILTNFLVENK